MGSGRVTWRKFHSEYPQILGLTNTKFSRPATRCSGFVHPCLNVYLSQCKLCAELYYKNVLAHHWFCELLEHRRFDVAIYVTVFVDRCGGCFLRSGSLNRTEFTFLRTSLHLKETCWKVWFSKLHVTTVVKYTESWYNCTYVLQWLQLSLANINVDSCVRWWLLNVETAEADAIRRSKRRRALPA